MAPGVLDELMAADQLDHDTETALARIAAILQRGFEAVLYAAGWKDVPHDLLEPDKSKHVGDMGETMKPKHVAAQLKAFPQAW
jgi:hypothetical protein